MRPVAGFSVPVIDPGPGMSDGVFPWTPNVPDSTAKDNAHVVVELPEQVGGVAADANGALMADPAMTPASRPSDASPVASRRPEATPLSARPTPRIQT